MLLQIKQHSFYYTNLVIVSQGTGKTVQIIAACIGNPVPPTLIIVQNNTESQWRDMILKMTGVSPMSIHCGFKGAINPQVQFVLTTYSVFTYNARGNKGAGNFPKALTGTHWGRIVLDEGHEMRNRDNNRYNNISELTSDIRWIATATPVHNHANDLVNQATWIGIHNVDLRVVVDEYMLRRTNEEIAVNNPRLRLPGLKVHDIKVDFRYPAERMLYEEVKHRHHSLLNKAAMLDCLMRRRQVCLHPAVYLHDSSWRIMPNHFKIDHEFLSLPVDSLLSGEEVVGAPSTTAAAASDDNTSTGAAQLEVAVEHLAASGDDSQPGSKPGSQPGSNPGSQPGSQPSSSTGSKRSRDECNDAALDAASTSTSKRARVTDQDDHPSSIKTDDHLCSTKMDVACRLIMQFPKDQFVVFCTYTLELRMLAAYLESLSVTFALYDGSLSQTRKTDVIYNFTNGYTRVLVCQIKCAACGLNLQAAHRVILMQPSFNPIEDVQAIHRCFRKGQTNVVHVYRPLIKDTVEMGIASKSASKLDIVSNTLGSQQLLKYKVASMDNTDIAELMRM